MEKTVSNQKKKFALNYVYAVLIGLLVIACATTIAVVNANNSNTKADIGGNATPIGASANVVGISVSAKSGHPIGWGQYCRYCVPATLIVLAISTIFIIFRYNLV